MASIIRPIIVNIKSHIVPNVRELFNEIITEQNLCVFPAARALLNSTIHKPETKDPNGSSHRTHAWELSDGRKESRARTARPTASERRPRASERRRPTSLLHSLSSVSYRKNEEVRFAFCVFLCLVSILVSCTTGRRSRSIHFFHSDRVLRPRVRRSWTHIRENTPFAIRTLRRGGVVGCGTDANARGSIGLGETLTDGWIPIRAATATVSFG